MSSDYEEFLENAGLSLRDLGLAERALVRTDALRAVTLLSQAGLPIIGGDVYWRKGSSIEPAYANWYVEQGAGESASDHAARSCQEALDYIRAFVEDGTAEALFALVVRRRR
jgi:Immunity protein 40